MLVRADAVKQQQVSATMGEITRSMERKWSYDLSATFAPSFGASAYEILLHCPCFGYIKFLMGGKPKRNDKCSIPGKNIDQTVSRETISRVCRYILPVVLLCMFAVDLGDWIVNGEAALQVQQTRIISMLTYLDSQFGLWLGTATTFIFISKSQRFLHCAYSLGQSMKQLNMLPFPANGLQKPTRLKIAWIIMVGLCICSTFRGVYGVWEATSPVTFWVPRKYFVFTVPSGLVAAILRSFFFFSEISALPVYIVFIFMCERFTQCFTTLSAKIKELLRKIENQRKDPVFGGVPFVDQLKVLSLQEVTLTQALMDLDECFAVQVLFFVVNNSLGVFSKIAKCFIATAFMSCMDYIKFSMKSSMYVLALGLVIVFPAILHENSSRSINLWQRLITVRQETRQEDYCPEESEVLVTLLQRTTSRKHSLTVAGIASLTRSFGVTLLLGFAGFTCFLIDRAENYKFDELSDNSTCNCTNY